jgi:acyl transferase domain-containing protein
VVEEIAERLAAEGVTTRALTVSHAFHSPLMDPMLAEFEQIVGRIACRPPRFPSSATSRAESRRCGVHRTRLLVPTYPAAGPVRRHDADDRGAGAGCFSGNRTATDLECPGPRLPSRRAQPWLPSVRAPQDELGPLQSSLGVLFGLGVGCGLEPVPSREARGARSCCRTIRSVGRLVGTILWPRWDSGGPPVAAKEPSEKTGHPLIGHRLDVAAKETVFQTVLRPESPAYLADHRVWDVVVTPAAALGRAGLGGGHRVLSERSGGGPRNSRSSRRWS